MLTDRLTEDMKTAMKARDSLRLSVLRMTLSEVKNVRIAKGSELEDADVQQVLRTALKRREESVEQYRQGGRDDLADQEAAEAEILRSYLPQQLDDDALEGAVDEAIAATGADSIKQMGLVMKHVMAAHGDRADGKRVQAVVRNKLGA